MKVKNLMGKQDPSTLSLTEHPTLIDENSLKCSHTPGKKGGVFSLPMGGQLSVPENCFNKKDVITCHVASPDTRWRTSPAHLPSYEIVSSEVYTFKVNITSLKKNVVLQLPFKEVNSEFQDVNVKGKWTGEAEWVNVGFLQKELHGRPCAELEVNRLGTFLVTVTPKTETFDVTTQGLLYQARLSRLVTVRFPKKAIDQNIQCALQMIPIPPDQVRLAREQFPLETEHVTQITDFVDVIGSSACKFKRAATIKLPLPSGMEIEVEGGGDAAVSAGHPDICVLYKSEATGWEVVESEYRFTRTTVTFDVKELTRFCVVQCIPGREKKSKESVNLIEGRNDRDKGEVCLFLSIRPKSWMALLEVLPKRLVDTRVSDMKAKGFKVVSRTQAPTPEPDKPVRFSRHRPPPPSRGQKKPEESALEIWEGVTWLLDVGGDVKVTQDSEVRENNQLKYFSRLGSSYRTFHIEPLDCDQNDPQALEGEVNLVPVGIRDLLLRGKMTFTFKLELDEATVVEYLAPESQPEEVEKVDKPKPVNYSILPQEKKVQPEKTPVPTRVREMPDSVMRRLTAPIRPVRVPERESRALTGKSLMTLARLIPEGLTLAVHLQLPDSTITGIGFDALSNNLNMSDVSYKILLYWKRKCKDKQMGAIRQLTDALKDMGYSTVAAAIMEAHTRHKEFTPEMVSHDELYSRVPVER